MVRIAGRHPLHQRMRDGAILFAAVLLCAACSLRPATSPLGFPSQPTTALDIYKVSVARRIAEANASRIAPGRPQALLRSVVSVEYWVDRRGNVVASMLLRDNGDRTVDAIALASLKRASPLPPPSRALLNSSGRVRLVETWLFNNDGRFQLRSIAAPQIGDE